MFWSQCHLWLWHGDLVVKRECNDAKRGVVLLLLLRANVCWFCHHLMLVGKGWSWWCSHFRQMYAGEESAYVRRRFKNQLFFSVHKFHISRKCPLFFHHSCQKALLGSSVSRLRHPFRYSTSMNTLSLYFSYFFPLFLSKGLIIIAGIYFKMAKKDPAENLGQVFLLFEWNEKICCIYSWKKLLVSVLLQYCIEMRRNLFDLRCFKDFLFSSGVIIRSSSTHHRRGGWCWSRLPFALPQSQKIFVLLFVILIISSLVIIQNP